MAHKTQSYHLPLENVCWWKCSLAWLWPWGVVLQTHGKLSLPQPHSQWWSCVKPRKTQEFLASVVRQANTRSCGHSDLGAGRSGRLPWALNFHGDHQSPGTARLGTPLPLPAPCCTDRSVSRLPWFLLFSLQFSLMYTSWSLHSLHTHIPSLVQRDIWASSHWHMRNYVDPWRTKTHQQIWNVGDL